MTSVLFTIGGAVVNALAFSGTNFVFGRLTNHGAKVHKRNDLAEEKLQRARDKWNEDQMKQIDFINKKLREKNEARTYINSVNAAVLECYRVFAKKLKPEPKLSNFYHPSDGQKNSELLFAAVGTGISTYALYKYLK